MFPLISVIVPVYNAGKYLDKCLKSIESQTYSNLQIILINDGSTDDSLQICERHAEKDKRITLISQENKGVIKARKTGIEKALGKYTCWVDSDDWIEADYISRLVELQYGSDADIVAVAHYHDIGNDSRLVKNGIENGTFETLDIASEMLYTGHFYEYGIGPHLVTKLFPTDILKKIKDEIDDNIVAGDDAAITYAAILDAQKICVSDMAGYHYVQNQGSITKTNCSDEISRIDSLIRFLRKKFNEKGLIKETDSQLHAYRNYLIALRHIDVFDRDADMLLTPFGGFSKENRIIIYGAGVLGQKIYNYLSSNNAGIIAWIDKNWQTYRNNGMNVDSPEKLKTLNFEYVIIANITENVAISIRRNLISMGIEPDKVRWFTDEFRCADIVKG